MAQTFVAASEKDAEGLLYELISECVFEGRPVGFDLETTGCNPQKESPVGRARLWCATFAWGAPSEKTPSPFRRAFVPREYVHVLKPFLEDHRYGKVGTNLFGFDIHACANEGIELRGIEACSSAMSRLLDPSKNAGHGNKAWGERLGYRVTEFSQVATVAVPGKALIKKHGLRCIPCGVTHTNARKRCPQCRATGLVLHAEEWGTEVRWEEKGLDELWRDYPHKRQQIVDYACQDPCMSLDTYWHLKARLSEVKW